MLLRLKQFDLIENTKLFVDVYSLFIIHPFTTVECKHVLYWIYIFLLFIISNPFIIMKYYITNFVV
jgi:hypothetical protein